MLSVQEAKAFQEAIVRGVPADHAFSRAKTEGSAFQAQPKNFASSRLRGEIFLKPLALVAAVALMVLVILPVFAVYCIRGANR